MTNHRLPLSAALVLALASCQGALPGKPAVGGAAAPGAAGAARTPAKAAKSEPPIATGAVAPAAASLLKPPAGQAVRLTGQVLVDDRYATTRGGASRLVGADGATLVGMDGASLVGPDGATLVAGGRVVAAGGGNVVVPSGLVGGDGALLIGADGASLVGADGASLVGASYATVQGWTDPAEPRDGRERWLAQADALAFGEARPAAGMWVSVVDVRTGLTVPLGKDAAGADAHTIYTDATGKFAVNVDPALAAHVRVVARAPGRRDPRLVLNVITSAGADERRIDDREAGVASFLRTIAARRLAGYFGLSEDGGETEDAVALGITAALGPVKTELEAVKAGPNGAANLHEVCLLLADRIILATGYENLALSLGANAEIVRHPESRSLVGRKVVTELRGVLARGEERVRARAAAAADPVAYFAAKPYLIAANLDKAPAQQYVIERPADMLDYVMREYFSSVRPGQDAKFHDVFEELEMSLLDHDRVTMAGPSLFEALLKAVAEGGDSPEAGGDVVAQMATFVRDARTRLAKASARPAPVPGRTAPPVVEPPAEPMRQVETIAGQPGVAAAVVTPDGPGRDSLLTFPSALALDERTDPPALYVAETAVIRRVTFDAAGQATVATLVGTAGKIAGAHGMAFDDKGTLYVSSSINGTIHRVSMPAEGPAEVVTIAGSGVPGFRDGPGAQAQFNNPSQLTLDPQGDLLVADSYNMRIRRIALSEPGFPVSTLLGNGNDASADGPMAPAPAIPGAETQGHPGAMPQTPVDVAFGPDGSLYYLEFNRGNLCRIDAPLGPTARARLVVGGRSTEGALDGYYHNVGFGMPGAFALDPREPRGRILIADGTNHRIRLVTPDRWVRTIAGGGPTDVLQGSHADGPGDQARFNRPTDLVVGKDGTIYVADTQNHVLRRIKP